MIILVTMSKHTNGINNDCLRDNSPKNRLFVSP